MGRNPDAALLTISRTASGEWFTADEAGVSDLKMLTRGGATKFLYLRKGEDFGAFAQMLLELLSRDPDQIRATIDLYQATFPTLMASIDVDKVLEMDWKTILAFYTVMTKGKELAVGTAKAVKKLFARAREMRPGIKVRILCNPDEVNEAALPGWQSMKCRVRHYQDPASAGTHRFYVSDRSYCHFTRAPDGTFFGFRGSDPAVIDRLTAQFESECAANKP